MHYRQGAFGRVFLLRFDDQDDLLEEMKKLAVKEQVRLASITLLGGMGSAEMVIGPKQAVIPPEPVWFGFNDGREIIGVGTLAWSNDGPAIHLHGAVGRGAEAHVGCLRKSASVYLVVEAVIAEITGIDARRTLDERTGITLLTL